MRLLRAPGIPNSRNTANPEELADFDAGAELDRLRVKFPDLFEDVGG